MHFWLGLAYTEVENSYLKLLCLSAWTKQNIVLVRHLTDLSGRFYCGSKEEHALKYSDICIKPNLCWRVPDVLFHLHHFSTHMVQMLQPQRSCGAELRHRKTAGSFWSPGGTWIKTCGYDRMDMMVLIISQVQALVHPFVQDGLFTLSRLLYQSTWSKPKWLLCSLEQ